MSKFYANFDIFFEFIYKSYNIYIINFIDEEKVIRKKNKPLLNTILSSEEDDNENFDKSFSSLTLQEKPKLKKPPFYKVIMLNDDYTPMEFVVEMLQTYFSKSQEQATEIMLHIHQKGLGVCGLYTLRNMYGNHYIKVFIVLGFNLHHRTHQKSRL